MNVFSPRHDLVTAIADSSESGDSCLGYRPALLAISSSPFRIPIGCRIRARAFSILEVVVAIGVVAFAFTALLGLLPVGMTIFSSALDTSVHSQIIQRFVSDAEQTDFNTLQQQPAVTRYFDDEGSESVQSSSVYTASMTIKPTTTLPKTAVSSNLVTLSIKIAKDPGHAADPFSPTSKLTTWTDVAFVARNSNK